jgi:hypothetical protein
MNPERLAQRLAEVCDLVRVDIFRCADAGPLMPAPTPTSGTVTWDEKALHDRLVAELTRLGVPRFQGHVPF